MNQQIIVKVIFPNVSGKAIVSSGNKIYIIPAMGYHKKQEVMIDVSSAILAPSLLYALAMAHEGSFEEAVKIIKENL